MIFQPTEKEVFGIMMINYKRSFVSSRKVLHVERGESRFIVNLISPIINIVEIQNVKALRVFRRPVPRSI